MASLGKTTAALKRWRTLSHGMPGPKPMGHPAATGGRLVEVSGFGSNPGILRMLVHRPASARPGCALVVVLHGCTQTAEGYAQGAGWLTLADRHGFVVLAPEQIAANNQNRCFNWFQPHDTRRGSGEAVSIAQMIERATLDHQIDRARVYVTGLSAGGAMTASMLASYPEVFAGGAIIAGLPHGAASGMQEAFGAMFQGRPRSGEAWGDLVRDASSHRGPWPTVSVWHGDADGTVVPGNADESVKQWLDVHGLADKPDAVEASARHTRRVWTDRSGRPRVEQHTLSGLGHGTPLAAGGPDGVGSAGPFLLEAGVSSSLMIAGSWGLTDHVAAPAVERPRPIPRVSAPPPRRAERPSAAVGSSGAPLDVRGVIERALSAAGLLK